MHIITVTIVMFC